MQVFQRVAEVATEGDAPTYVPDAPGSMAMAPPSIESERPIVHPVPPSRPSKRKREDDPDEEPANFTRVRIKMKKRRLNKDQPGQALSAEKRKSDDAMDVDPTDGSPKRHKYEDPQGHVDEQGHSAKTYLQRQQQQEEIKAWTPSQPVIDFNKSFGIENPSTFSATPCNTHDAVPDSTSTAEKANDQVQQHATSTSDCQPGQTTSCTPIEYTEYVFTYEDSQSPQRSPRQQRASSSSKAPKKPTSRQVSKATEEDARRAGIPAGYSLKNWDPTEEPLMVLGSVFDANSLGKWIYDWAVYAHGPATPVAEMAGELWLSLIQLAGKIKRAEETFSKIRNPENRDMVEDFLESGDRLWIRFARLLKTCERYMLKAAEVEAGAGASKAAIRVAILGKNTGVAFVDSMFGRDCELCKTEKMITGMRLWSMRFDANCEEILRYPLA